MVKDINPGLDFSSPLDLTVAGDELYFVAIEPGNPDFGSVFTSLWKSDGTESGTVKVWQAPGEYWGYGISELTLVGDKLYFLAPTGMDDMGFSVDFELYALLVPEPTAGLMLLAASALLLKRRRA
jgi:ELWxxDGT repeat protein